MRDNAKRARAWIKSQYACPKDETRYQGHCSHCLTVLLDQKDAEWERVCKEVRKWAEGGVPGTSACDEIMERMGVKG